MHRGQDCEDYLIAVLATLRGVRTNPSLGPVVVREMQRMRDECGDRHLDLAALAHDIGEKRMARIAAFKETDRDSVRAAAMVHYHRTAIKRDARGMLSSWSAWLFSFVQ